MRNQAFGVRWYNMVWRWHFYAGLFCIPFVIWLSLTGLIYLWRPQIETWIDRPYDHLATQGPPASAEAQVAAALSAVPGSTLHKYILPDAPNQAVRVLVTKEGIDRRVYVDPQSLAVLGNVAEEQRPLRVVMRLHGQLLAGDIGSYIVEIAACWAVVMLITGLYLWWPRGAKGLARVLYPRLRGGKRLFWRDIHATAGIWVSVAAMGLILTGLPWAKAWGGYLAEIRQITGAVRGPVDWTIGGKAPARATPSRTDRMLGVHAAHEAMGMAAPSMQPGELSRVIAAARPLGIAAPVLIMRPQHSGQPWAIASDAANRPLRSDVQIDGTTGRVLGRIDFADRHWIDRVVGYGIAVHEGALFGLLNQLLGTVTALLLVTLAVSGAIMWWRRRPKGLLGAPPSLSRPRFGAVLIASIATLAIYMPMFGATIVIVLGVEELAISRWAKAAQWLGLRHTVGIH